MKFRKKPVEIEAVQWNGMGFDIASMPDWLRIAASKGDIERGGNDRELLLVKTMEGTMQANPQDWIICGVKGELYPCKPDIFAATYDPV